MEFNAVVKEIKEQSVIYEKDGEIFEIDNEVVFAMTGYHPDYTLLTHVGVEIHCETGRPTIHAETMETNVQNLFVAGVIVAGNNANEIFIENGRFHGGLIAKAIQEKEELN